MSDPAFRVVPGRPDRIYDLIFRSFILPELILPPFPKPLMTVTTPTVPNEETPLLGAQCASEVEGIPGSDSESATMASLSDRDGLTRADSDGGAIVVKKTPLPWPQFSIVLFLLLAEPLTSQVISPVSFGRLCPLAGRIHDNFFFFFAVCTRGWFKGRPTFRDQYANFDLSTSSFGT